jgi:hypothetical protein
MAEKGKKEAKHAREADFVKEKVFFILLNCTHLFIYALQQPRKIVVRVERLLLIRSYLNSYSSTYFSHRVH